MKQIIRLVILTFLITSCNHDWNKGTKLYNLAVKGVNSETSSSPIDNLKNPEINKKKIIKDGKFGIKVSDLDKSKSRTDILVKNNGGYYAKESFSNTDNESSYDLKIRIPSDNFEKFITELESGVGGMQYKEIEARDVTDQFIDLETRLGNKRNYLNRYNDLLKQANSVTNILEIEEKIRGLEEEVESTTGRLKYLGDLVDFSTLDLKISSEKDFKYTPAQKIQFTQRLKYSLSAGWYGFINLIFFLIKIWPFWIIVSVIIYLWRKFKKKKK